MSVNVVAVSGSLHTPSKSTALLGAITAAIETKIDATTTLVEVSALGAGLGGALRRDQLSADALEAIERVEGADLLVVASPVYRGTYTGLFKHLFDLVGQAVLADTPVIVAASGGDLRHSLVIEHQLKPLFAFFGADVVPHGVYAKDADYDGYTPVDPDLIAQVDRAVRAAVTAVS